MSPYICIENTLIKSGICSRAYGRQVLEEVAVPFLQGLEEGIENTIFMEDGSKVHLGHAKAVKKRWNLLLFSKGWPPSSPDLNPIEKVWRWMKARITEMEPFPATIEELKIAVQQLWDEMDPADYIKYIEQTPEKLQEVIRQQGYATKY